MWDYLFWLDVTSSAFHPIRLQDSLIIDICGKNLVVLSFFKWWKPWREYRTWNYYFLDGCGLLCLLSNQIEGFYDKQ